jgi:hypothetical protein
VTSSYVKAYIVTVMGALLTSCHRQPDRRLGSFSVVDPAVSKQLVAGKYMHPSNGDSRQLGVVVNRISFRN